MTGKTGPTIKQAKFLLLPQLEAFYGGAAAGGKSDALLMASLMFVDIPGYNAIIFRRTYQDLALPSALMDRSLEWLGGKARWDRVNHTWVFPSTATLSFGYLQFEPDKYRYQSAEFHFEGFDELTEFSETQYTYLISRARRLEGCPIPVRVRSASNPGGAGHDWVKRRFITEGYLVGDETNIFEIPLEARPFIPARLEDNPFSDRRQYEASLAQLDSVTRQQLRFGNWEITQGYKFKRGWFMIVRAFPAATQKVRYWDLASTVPKKGKDPDYTAGALLTEKDGQYWIVDLKFDRGTPKDVEALVAQTAASDGTSVDVFIEQEPGSAGIAVIDHYQREVLKGFAVKGVRTTGDKETRANPVSAAAEAGNMFIVEGTWNSAFLDEAEVFPYGRHDDKVDAVCGAFEALSKMPSGEIQALSGKKKYW